jgi:hypothetical protein
MKSLSDLSVADLRRVIALKEQIEALEGQLEVIAENEVIAANTGGDAGAAETPLPPSLRNAVCPQRIGANLSKLSQRRERYDGQKRSGPTRPQRNAA